MSGIWNKEFYVALEGRDLQATAMAVDATGNYLLLAGYTALRSLEDEPNIVERFPRQSKYDVNVAEWNPTSINKELCVLSCNQRLEVLTWRQEELAQTHLLKAHTRVITDLNWHRCDPNLLASCSVDTFIHIWDIRDARRPTLSLSAVAEASQVRWNKGTSSYLLATAHEGDIKLWDQRKGTAPVQYIAAHLSKIHGLEWSHKNESTIISASQDCTVKFFDITNPRKAEITLSTNSPIWKARCTPFGNGIVTIVVPQLKRGENSLILWNTLNRSTPMYTFVGHRDVVLEFAWRKIPHSDEYQLITWSRDQSLLVWKIEPFLQKLVGFEPDEVKDVDEVSSVILPLSEPVKAEKKAPKVQHLQQEFSLLNDQIPNLEVKKLDASSRSCSIKATVNSLVVNLQITFPNNYPIGVSPVFQVAPGTNIPDKLRMQLLQTLNNVASQRVAKNRTCLEPCLRQMVSTLEQNCKDIEKDPSYENPFLDSPLGCGGCNDAYIPFPRTSGAKFCSVSTLVCFGRLISTRRMSSKKENSTPRALSALENVLTKRSNDYLSVSAYYFQKQRSRAKHSNARSVVHIYEALGLFHINKQLAEEYILDGDVGTICKHNAAAAAVVGRRDLVQAWTLAELVVAPQQADEEMPWATHPFGNQLMQSLIHHYASQSDLQMAAMLCCIFGKENDLYSKKRSTAVGSGGSPYHTIPPADIIAESWVLPTKVTTRSSSLDNLRLEEHQISFNQKFSFSALHEYYKLAYAETLHRWGLLYNRAEVIKYMCHPPDSQKGIVFLTDCKYCKEPAKYTSCSKCYRLSLSCVVCHISVRGSANCCIYCGHGGHTKHLEDWFETKDMCPTGCGCRCLLETSNMFQC